MVIKQKEGYDLFISNITIRSEHLGGKSDFSQLKEERSLEILAKSDKMILDKSLYRGKIEGDLCTISSVSYSSGGRHVRITFDEYVELDRPKIIKVVERRRIERSD